MAVLQMVGHPKEDKKAAKTAGHSAILNYFSYNNVKW